MIRIWTASLMKSLVIMTIVLSLSFAERKYIKNKQTKNNKLWDTREVL